MADELDTCQVCRAAESSDVLWIHLRRCPQHAYFRRAVHKDAKRWGTLTPRQRAVFDDTKVAWMMHLHNCRRHTHVHLCGTCWTDYLDGRGPLSPVLNDDGARTGTLPPDVMTPHGHE